MIFILVYCTAGISGILSFSIYLNFSWMSFKVVTS
jgi:hypothetical protein